MRYRKTVILLTVLLMVFSFNTFAKQKTIKRVNVAPLMKAPKGGISSADQLRSMVEENAERIQAGFEKADASNLFPAFMNQIKSAEITEQELPKGQEMQWMLFYSAKKAKAIKDVKWDANKSLPVFALTIQSDCKDYHFIIPKACGNISLVNDTYSMAVCDVKVSPAKANIGDNITIDMSASKCAQTLEVTILHENTQYDFKKIDGNNPIWKTSFSKSGNYSIEVKAVNAAGVLSTNECSGKVYINFPPECDLKVSPMKSYIGKPFKLDASGSTDKDGKVVKADFTITDLKDGKEFETNSITTEPLVWNKIFKKSGKYNVSVKVTDDFNAVGTNKCDAEIEVQKRLYFLLEGGPGLTKGTYTMTGFARLGLSYLIIPERLSFVVSAGGNFVFNEDPFKHHFISNLLLNVHMGGFFIGGGIGYTSEVREPDWGGGVDVVGNIGFDVYSAFNKKASVFGEIRVPLRDDLSFEHGHQFLFGFRFLF